MIALGHHADCTEFFKSTTTTTTTGSKALGLNRRRTRETADEAGEEARQFIVTLGGEISFAKLLQ